jgi:uncharacterized repeat protein (TIGR03803 family)
MRAPTSSRLVFVLRLGLLFGYCMAVAITSSAQTLTTLVNFSGSDGNQPQYMQLLQATDGYLYGTTEFGGSTGHGTIFKMTTSGTLTSLYSFTAGNDGEYPAAGLVQGVDGNFYGTTRTGGAHCCGTVFKITPSGTFTTIYSFRGTPDGSGLYAPLVVGTDGNLYSTTGVGGANGSGMIFKITPSGTVTTLYSFCPQPGCTDGKTPYSGLVLAKDGNFYGVTNSGGSPGYGVVFKITPNGAYSVLHNFDFNNEGGNPRATVMQANDGNFYGTTYLGGSADSGTVYKLTPGGTFTLLFTFCRQLDCSVGGQPLAGVIQASDGNLYGTTTGGNTGHGTIYKITPSGTASLLYTFCTHQGCPDGNGPWGGLMQASNGYFYGTTNGGGAHNDGTIYSLTGSQLISTSTTLTTTPNPSNYGQSVTMTATVHAQNGSTPTGDVFFQSDGVWIGAAILNGSGVAVLNYSGLSMGTHSVRAVYQGQNGYADSTSNAVQQVVTLPLSTTTVTSTPNPSMSGQQVTITATVGPNGPPQPTGTVGFASNGSGISGCTSVVLNSGTAQCTTSALPVGTDTIVATYSGDANYGPSSGSVVQIVNPPPSAMQFVAVPPCRIVDTRRSNGTFGGPRISGNTARAFPLAQSGNPCGITADAVAYSLNVTAVPVATLGYLTIWPSGQGQPSVSTLNSLDGRIKANAAIIPAGSPDGSVSVYVTNNTDVILDINGYFKAADGSTLAFYPVTPCRVADTRHPDGPLGGPYLQAGQERDFPVLQSACGLPGTADAYSLNFTVVPKTSGGVAYLTVWPQGQTRPVVSTLNDLTNTVVANAAIVPAGTEGGVATYPSNDTDLIIDVNGYFAPQVGNGLSFYALTPCRVVDTRRIGNGQPFTEELTVDVEGSACGPPAISQGYVFNATVVPQGSLSYLTLWPDSVGQPVVSTLNALDGAITSNMAIVPNVNGKTDAWAAGYTQMILDISGYFAP